MLGVLYGFAVILGIIGAGYLAAVGGVVKGDQRRVLNRMAFYVALPALLFAALQLHDLRDDPDAAGVDNLPYPNLPHLRDCLRELQEKGKTTKTVIRFLQQDVLYRTIRRGFYVAQAGGGFRFFPMPAREQLETDHYPWWRSALSTFGA